MGLFIYAFIGAFAAFIIYLLAGIDIFEMQQHVIISLPTTRSRPLAGSC